MRESHVDSQVAEQLLRTLGMGVALVEPDSLAVTFENARFFQWFPPAAEPDEPLDRRLPGIERAKLAETLAKRRRLRQECEVKAGPRTVVVAIEIQEVEFAGRPYLLVECRDISGQREAEYMLDSYSKLAEKRARELQREKERVERLLLNIMPRSVYEEMRDFGTTTPQRFDAASVLMLDFAGFTDMAVSRDPGALIAELNDIFSAFDRIVELFGCERIKTIGDAYLAVSGLPEPTPDHASNIAKVALRMRRYIERRNLSHPNQWLCRIGIATGPLIGSIVGIQKYVYDVFGPAINLAARLESLSPSMAITLCARTRELLGDGFLLEELGTATVRGFGEQELYALKGEREDR